MLPEKLFGIYRHKVLQRKVPLVRGFDDIFLMPHSRYTAVPAKAIHECRDLVVLAESDEAGVMLCMSRDGRQIFSMGHAEYDRQTLDKEYRRDVAKNLDIDVPKNYYPENDPDNKPLLEWRSHCDMLYSNCLNYYVYQNTPYMWGQILDEGNRRKASHMLTERTLDTEE